MAFLRVAASSNHDIKEGEEYAILTNIIHQEWADVDVHEHKA